MLAMGAADYYDTDDAGPAADVLEYRRWKRPYFAIWRRALPDEEETCLKQGKTRLTII
jgi:molybdopterin-guanine dinucleotide biosynthesis protein A